MNPQDQRSVQIPIDTTRDGDGRLVGMTIDCGRGLTSGSSNPWLVAVDGSEQSQNAVVEAVRLAAAMKDCTLHVVNVQHWMSKEAAESDLKSRGVAATTAAWALLNKAQVPWCLHIVMGESAERIVALAAQLGCHGIVIGSRCRGATETLLLGSVATKVLHLSSVPVLVVR